MRHARKATRLSDGPPYSLDHPRLVRFVRPRYSDFLDAIRVPIDFVHTQKNFSEAASTNLLDLLEVFAVMAV
jgi:hypothetical protein